MYYYLLSIQICCKQHGPLTYVGMYFPLQGSLHDMREDVGQTEIVVHN